MRSGVKAFAWRAIRMGEEITIDYRLKAFGGSRSRCLCGTRAAVARAGSFFALDPERQRRYLPGAQTSSGVSTGVGTPRADALAFINENDRIDAPCARSRRAGESSCCTVAARGSANRPPTA